MTARQEESALKNRFNAMAALERIRANPKITLLISAAAVISVLIALLLWTRTPDYRVLYSTISDQDGGAIVAQLQQMQVPYRFEQGGAIMVPKDKVYEARLALARQGLPKGGAVGFELLDQEKFGISQFSEQINYQRGLEGELSRTIETLGPVQRARVHLAMPKPSLFVHEQQPPSASVTLNLHPGRTLDAGQVNAVAYLVSSAVAGLAADKVTILDQSGHLLSQNQSQALQTAQLTYTRNLEDEYQRRIQAILAPVLGVGNVRAQVTAQLDFTLSEQTAEQYQPNTAPDKMAIRSRQTNLSEQGGRKGAEGIPGALTNQPPVPATAPIEKPAPAQNTGAEKKAEKSTSGSASGSLQSYSSEQGETTNYELDRTLTHIKHSSGTIQRLSVAVVVNYQDGKEGKATPLSKTQLTQIETLVKEAIGYSASRGDSVNVVNTAFVSDEHDAALPPFWKQPAFINLLISATRYLLIALTGWVLWRKLVQPAWFRQQEFVRQRLELEKAAHQAALDAKKERQEKQSRARAQQRIDTEVGAQQLRDIAEHEPQLIALVIRQWMNKE
ncbi:flagellar basal-body MS-ring/collar protein FliF [[Erwinia] mediterraneensis]|uniref:flagellar basal-body MS-ring/collar protein FliF n=1 Tax=[Erwinia] mediterraneensis TaxID=2161819 RepID=UPI00103105D5|nr:flagellar basal-body MS-ring/collar protein FliF [[Erwinia] mediterraneensis]